jgi:hypothetical protein
MIYLIGAGFSTEKEVERIRMLPEFRKATRNMAMAYASLERLVSEIPTEVLRETGLVFGSSHGELETTKEFLKTLAEQRVARPILFQNSLHNSTVGFLAMKIGITAPTVTLGNGMHTAEDVFEAARMLLLDGMLDSVFVTVADGVVPELRSVMEMNHGPSGMGLGEGAATLLMTTKPERFTTPWIARFSEGFRIVRSHSSSAARVVPIADSVPDYDTNTLERLALAITNKNSPPFFVAKRDGGFSEITWKRPA